jgi:hypothetical protein
MNAVYEYLGREANIKARSITVMCADFIVL